jgi:hypothetical protein
VRLPAARALAAALAAAREVKCLHVYKGGRSAPPAQPFREGKSTAS